MGSERAVHLGQKSRCLIPCSHGFMSTVEHDIVLATQQKFLICLGHEMYFSVLFF